MVRKPFKGCRQGEDAYFTTMQTTHLKYNPRNDNLIIFLTVPNRLNHLKPKANTIPLRKPRCEGRVLLGNKSNSTTAAIKTADGLDV